MLRLYDLTVDYLTSPVGMDRSAPRFSWKLDSNSENTVQTAYVLKVNGETVSKAESSQSILIPYTGQALLPRRVYTWEVTVWDNHGQSACAQSSFETGLMNGNQFAEHAQWITSGWSAEQTASPVFVKTFPIAKPVSRARLYATCLGLYEAELNGSKLGDTFFAPGWTSYRKRLQYQTYPLELKPGENELRLPL